MNVHPRRHLSDNSSNSTDAPPPDADAACAGAAPGDSRTPDLGGAIGIMVDETGGALAGVGLTHAHFVLLLAVSEFEPVSVDLLGRIMAVGAIRCKAELDDLVSKGTVVVDTNSEHGENVVTTAHGRNLLQRAIPLWEAAQERIQDRLGVERRGSQRPVRSDKPLQSIS